jgi:hypothetical protein
MIARSPRTAIGRCISSGCSSGLVVLRTQAELGEALVLPHELRRGRVENAEQLLQSRAIERLFQIFYGVELDTTLAQHRHRAARLTSTRVDVES